MRDRGSAIRCDSKMPRSVITSRQNPAVKRFRDAAEAGGEELLLDGPHLVAEALLAHLPVEVVAVDSAAANGEVAALARRAAEAGAQVLDVSPSVLEAMSPVRQSRRGLWRSRGAVNRRSTRRSAARRRWC